MKIGIVVQRYGKEINGGAELHAKQLAEQLNNKHEVRVITTQSKSYNEWDNQLNNSKEIINNIEILRFPSVKKNHVQYRKYIRRMNKTRRHHRLFKRFGLFSFFDRLGCFEPSKKSFQKWLIHQGPYCEGLVDFLKENKSKYDVFIFFTYLYYPTNIGLPEVALKSILIPTAHDEPPFYYKGYENLFRKVGFIMYNSESEKELVEKTYPIAQEKPNDIAGVGIEKMNYKKYKSPIKQPYFVYIGRIDVSKNMGELIRWFEKYTEHNPEIRLVLIGQNVSEFSAGKQVIFTGFISDDEKYQWLLNAQALIIPSKFESLSMVTLEAMEQGVPVIANAYCDVLDDHIKRSEAGFSYRGFENFSNILNKTLSLTEKEKSEIGNNGKNYVKKYYQWEEILKKFDRAFELIKHKK